MADKPLISWTIEAARASRSLDRLVVSSDDPQVLRIAHEYDPKLPLARPRELAADASPAIDYVRHALQTLESSGPSRFEVIVILQPTSPFTLAADIDATVGLLAASGADSAVSVTQVEHAVHPVKLKTMQGDRLLPYWEEERGRMAAEQLPRLFVRNCSVYVTRRSVIDAGEIIGRDCRGYVMPRERSLDINEPIDFDFAEFLLKRSAASRGD